MLSYNLFHRFNDNGYLYNLLSNFLDVLIYSNYLRNHSFNLYQLWNFNELLPNSFDLVDLRNSNGFLYYLFNDLLSSNYLLYFRFDGNKFLNNSWYFFNNLLEVWY